MFDKLLQAFQSYLGVNKGAYPMMQSVKGASTANQPKPTTPTVPQRGGDTGPSAMQLMEKFRTGAPAPIAVNNSGGGGGGGESTGDQGGGMSNEERIARERYGADMQQANDIYGRGRQTFDTLMDSIRGFRDRSQTGFSNAGQQITNTAAETLGSNAVNADAMRGQARARGRAMGLGDSSKFNMQNKIDGNFAADQGSVLARRGENERANQLNLDENLAQAQTQEGNANTYLQGIGDYVNNLGRQNAATYAGNLNGIVDYQRQLSAMQPMGAAQQYNADFSGTANNLNSVMGGFGGQQVQGGDMASNLVNSQTFMDLMNQKKKNPYLG